MPNARTPPLALPLLALVMLALAALAGCPKDGGAATTTTASAAKDAGAPVEEQPDVRVTAADQTCTSDAECTLVSEDCCGCSALGKQVGVRADKLDAVAKRRGPICAAVSCAQQLSDDPSCNAAKAVCRAGQCVPDLGAAAPSKPVPTEPIPPG